MRLLLRTAAWAAVCSMATRHVTMRNMASGDELSVDLDPDTPLTAAAEAVAATHGVHPTQVALFRQEHGAPLGHHTSITASLATADENDPTEILYSILPLPVVSPDDLDDPRSGASQMVELLARPPPNAAPVSLWPRRIAKDPTIDEITALAARHDGWNAIGFARLFPDAFTANVVWQSGERYRLGKRQSELLDAFLRGVAQTSPESLPEFLRGGAAAEETPLARARRIISDDCGSMIHVLLAHGVLAEVSEEDQGALLEAQVDDHVREWDSYDNYYVAKFRAERYASRRQEAGAHTSAVEAILAQGVDPSATEAGRRAMARLRVRLRSPQTVWECFDFVLRPLSERRRADRRLLAAMTKASAAVAE